MKNYWIKKNQPQSVTLLSILFFLCLTLSFFSLGSCREKSLNNAATQETRTQGLKVSSPAFKTGGMIPSQYTCDGKNINPPLTIENVPGKAKSLVLTVDDPDAPRGSWNHWLVWNIDPKVHHVAENSVPHGAVLGTNSFEKLQYGGPCPPSGTHRYYFRVLALSQALNTPQGGKLSTVLQKADSIKLSEGSTMGRYNRQH